MSARVKVLVALVALLAGAHLALALTRDDPARVDPLVTRFDPVAIYRIELSRDQREVALERGEGGWVVASHGGVPTRPSAPDRFLELLGGWRQERVAGRDPSRHMEWGVAAPSARRIRLLGKTGNVLVDLHVGAVTGIDRDAAKESGYNLDSKRLGMFVRREGEDEVVVVNAFLTTLLEPTPRTWFRRPLLEFDPRAIRRLRVEPPGREAIELTIGPDGVAALTSDRRPLSPGKVQGLLQRVLRLDPLGAGQPLLGASTRWTLESADGSRKSFLLWSAGERWFLESESLRVEVAPAVARSLAGLDPSELLRERLTPFDMGALGRMHWNEGDDELAVRLTRGLAWEVTQLRSSAGGLVYTGRPPGAAKELRRLLGGLTVARWDPAAGAALERPWARLILVEPRRMRSVLVLGERQGDLRAVRVEGIETPGWLREADVQSIRAAFLKLAPN